MKKMYIKYFTIFAAVILTIVVGLLVYRTFVFQITNVDPPGGKLPTSQQTIQIKFNKDIEEDNISSSIRVNSANYITKAKGKTVEIRFSQTFDVNQNITVELINIRSKSGSTLSQKLSFVAGYVPYDKLTAAERARQTESSNSFEDFDLIKVLPTATTNYEIRYIAPDKGEDQMVIVITSLKIPFDNPMADLSSPSMLNAIREARTEAISWLQANGYNDQRYRLEFTEPVLLEEFGGTALQTEPLEFHESN